MKKHTSLFLWENNRNLNILLEYRKIFHNYFEAYRKEDPKAISELRTRLVMNAPKAEEALVNANVYPWMEYGSQAGGYRQISITHELPEFVKNQVSRLGSEDDTLAKIDDMYLRAIGIYGNNKLHSLLNMFNPFLYINALVKIFLLPFFTILDVKPIKQDNGIWWFLQLLLRIPTYYVMVVHPLIILFGKSNLENKFFERIINLF